MVPPIEMSMDARMVLAKMSVIFEREKGKRVKLSSDQDVVDVINFGWETLNHEYLRYFEIFCKMLSPTEIQMLAAQGAQIYRGAEVKDQPESAPSAERKAKVMYRGQLVDAPASAEPVANTAPAPAPVEEPKLAEPFPSAEAPKKKKRVYRGRVIEE